MMGRRGMNVLQLLLLLLFVVVTRIAGQAAVQLAPSSASSAISSSAAVKKDANANANAAASASAAGGTHNGLRCEEITIPMCRGIGYNWTSMPNSLHHESQEEAGLEVHQFWPLVEIQCSPDMRFFLCSIYAPICIQDYPTSIPACKSVCLRAESGCAPLMRKYGFAWPERMQCDKFPSYGDPLNLCMDARNGTLPQPTPAPPPHSAVVPTGVDVADVNKPALRPHPAVIPAKNCKGRKCGLLPSSSLLPDEGVERCECECRPPLIQLYPSDGRFNRSSSLSVGGVANCLLPCTSPFFSEEERWFASLWIATWAAVAALSSATTFATFLIDRPRFRYPERPLIFLSACYVGLSVGYLVRIGTGGRDQVACEGDTLRYGAAPSLMTISTTGHDAGQPISSFIGVSSSTSSPTCVVTFLLVYFFGQAAGLWWVILSLTWFLAAGRKWGSEAIARCSPYFHLVAWTIPAIQTAAALLMAAVDGDALAGVCTVGVQQTVLLRWLVLFPLGIHLLLGGGFLLAGLVGLARIRRVLKEQGRPKAEKLEKLMIRIGIFSVLYSVPAAILLGCYTYEVAYHVEWGRTLTCAACPDLQSAHQSRPDFSIFMLKYFMTLVVGITSGFWIWSHKTLDSWRRFYGRLCHSRPKAPVGTSPQHHHQLQAGHPMTTPQAYHPQYQQSIMMPVAPPIPPLLPPPASTKSLIKQPLMQSVQSHLGSTYKAPSHV